ACVGGGKTGLRQPSRHRTGCLQEATEGIPRSTGLFDIRRPVDYRSRRAQTAAATFRGGTMCPVAGAHSRRASICNVNANTRPLCTFRDTVGTVGRNDWPSVIGPMLRLLEYA
ncbi:unnamed protein product, partial [Ectocarpus sp. 12 AP-2014]